jgi:amino acid transporter
MIRPNTDLIVGLSSLASSGVAYFVTRDLSPLGGVFVRYVLIMLTILSLASIVVGLVKPQKLQFFDSVVERNNILFGLLLLLIYLILLPRAGFLLSSYGFYFVISLYLSENRWAKANVLKSALLSAIVVTAFYFIFHGFLAVPLPEGTWLRD